MKSLKKDVVETGQVTLLVHWKPIIRKIIKSKKKKNQCIATGYGKYTALLYFHVTKPLEQYVHKCMIQYDNVTVQSTNRHAC